MSILDNIKNHYESWVIEELNEQVRGKDFDEDTLTDVTCVALNRLPPRYYRHEVDMVFYMTPAEYEELRQKVRVAVTEALEFVAKNQRP